MIDWFATDAIAFDMDGTLWDAVDSYCKIWNVCFERRGLPCRATREEVEACMGLHIDEILRRLAGEAGGRFDAGEFLSMVAEVEERMMPELGGKVYPGVTDGIRRLSELYPVFLISNCGTTGLDNLMEWAGIRPFVKEALSYGRTRRPKSENMRSLMEKYGLRQLVYAGDTEDDCLQTRLAGQPFVFASYGFGHCRKPDMSAGSFQEIVDFFVDIKKQEL